MIVKSVLQNAGQTCSAGSRLLLHEDIRDAALDGVAQLLARVRIGAGPTDPDLGPLISAKQRNRVESMVTRAADAEVFGPVVAAMTFATHARALVLSFERDDCGLARVVNSPFKFDGEAPSVRRPPPRMGEHNEERLQRSKKGRSDAASV